MKKLYAGLCGLLILFGSTTARSIELEIRSQVNQVPLGGFFEAELYVSGLGSEDLAGFDIDLAYDSTLLSFVDHSLGTDLTDPLFGQFDLSRGEVSPGLVNVAEVSFLTDFSSQLDSFLLASLTFGGIAPGESPLEIVRYELSDAFAGTLTVGAVENGQVYVPLPGTAFLLAPLGIGLLVHQKKTKEKRSRVAGYHALPLQPKDD